MAVARFVEDLVGPSRVHVVLAGDFDATPGRGQYPVLDRKAVVGRYQSLLSVIT